MFTNRLAVLASIGIVFANSALAQAPASRPNMQLTALDYIEIEQLNRKYAWALDHCFDDGFAYADLYTPDGKFISGDSGKVWQGRTQLAEAAGGNGRGCAFPKMPLEHVIANLVIEASPDGATGKSYLIYPGRNGKYVDDQHHGHDGGYQDIYVKTTAGWRFKSRVHVYPPQIPGSYAGVPNSQLPESAARKPQ